MILTVPYDCPCQVFDADGVELKYAIWADTETGEAVHYVRDGDGFVIEVHEHGQRGPKCEWRKHPAPLTVTR
jgi:hypothetical protein